LRLVLKSKHSFFIQKNEEFEISSFVGLIRMVGEHEILYARFYTAEESLSPSISGRRAQLVIRMGRVLKIAQNLAQLS